MSSARDFILLRYSLMVMPPFFILANAMCVFTARVHVWEEKISSMDDHSWAAVFAVATCFRTSRIKVVSK